MLRGHSTISERARAGVFREDRGRQPAASLEGKPGEPPPKLSAKDLQFLSELQRRVLSQGDMSWTAIAALFGVRPAAIEKRAAILRRKLGVKGLFSLHAFVATTRCALLLQSYQEHARIVSENVAENRARTAKIFPPSKPSPDAPSSR